MPDLPIEGQPFDLVYRPLVNGQTYDPVNAGGSVDRLRLWAAPDRAGAPVVDIGPAAKVAEGQYQFAVPAIADAGAYYSIVDWTPSAGADPITDADDVVIVYPFDGSFGPQFGKGVCELWTDVAEVRAVNEAVTVAAVPDDRVTTAIRWASDMLFDLSGRRWSGECVRIIRPVHGRGCHGVCRRAWEWPLGPYPVARVLEVRLDGAVLVDGTDYRLDDNRVLVMLDRSRRWPCSQDVRLPLTEDGTWSASYVTGAPPPAGGYEVAAILSAELSLAMKGDKKCRLPARTQQVVRQGVTITVYPQGLIDGGRTGIAEIDLWLASVNPTRNRARSTVHSPDFRSTARHT